MVTSYTPSFPCQSPFKMHTSLAGENIIILQEENGCVKEEGVALLDSAWHAVLGLHCSPCMSLNFTYVCVSLLV